MQTLRRIVDTETLARGIALPEAFAHQRVEIIIRPLEQEAELPTPAKDAAPGKAKLPRLTHEQIDEMVKGSVAESLVGCLNKGSWDWLPPSLTPENITMKDIRELRLKEKYGI
jgi:hypothetical protein